MDNRVLESIERIKSIGFKLNLGAINFSGHRRYNYQQRYTLGRIDILCYGIKQVQQANIYIDNEFLKQSVYYMFNTTHWTQEISRLIEESQVK